MRRLGLLALVVALAACVSADRVVVAAGTTLVDSGFLDSLVDDYEAETGRQVSVVGDATARVLELGRRGAAGVLITHDPDAEAAFVAAHPVRVFEPLFVSRFVLAGPSDRVEELAGLTAPEALAVISDRAWTFVSRADRSGTHVRELQLWREAGIDPNGESWYVETGLGMGETLQVADQRRAFVLAELGALRSAPPVLDLVAVDLGPPPLDNPYSVIVPQSAGDGAVDFVAWIRSEAGRRAVLAANEQLFGDVIYRPAP